MTDLLNVLGGVAPLHMGALHAYEKLLVALIALGPFVVLAVVVYVVRRRDIAEEAGARDAEAPAPDRPASTL